MPKQNKLVLERTIHAPLQLVWQSLTDITLLKKWLPFFPDFKPEVGFETRFLLGPDEDHQYTHICQVVEVIPSRKLTYTWKYAEMPGDSHVNFELTPQGENTKVILTHAVLESFPVDNPDVSPKNFAEGWTYTIEGLKQFAEKEGSNDK